MCDHYRLASSRCRSVSRIRCVLLGAWMTTGVAGSRANLGVAFRTRAGIRVRLRDYAGAQADLNTAIPLIGERAGPEDAAILSGFRARLAEVEAQTLAETNRKRAIAALDCRVLEMKSVATHDIYFGEVAAIRLANAEKALVYHARAYKHV